MLDGQRSSVNVVNALISFVRHRSGVATKTHFAALVSRAEFRDLRLPMCCFVFDDLWNVGL